MHTMVTTRALWSVPVALAALVVALQVGTDRSADAGAASPGAHPEAVAESEGRSSQAEGAEPAAGAGADAPRAAPADAVRATAAPSRDESAWRAREGELLRRIASLEAELAREQERSVDRTQEWVTYVEMLQGVTVADLPAPPEFIQEAMPDTSDPAAEAEALADRLARARGDRIEHELRALLIADGVRTLDVLEVGAPGVQGGKGFTGPVVARILDERGRLTGMYSAERMWIEVSRAARSATIVLEDGYQTQRGVRTSFDGRPMSRRDVEGSGVRRVPIPSVDPETWIDALPDIVAADDLAPFVDDGAWDLTALRVTLARLLSSSSVAGGPEWRLVGLGGVRGNDLHDVQLGEVPRPGARIGRRIFADSARIFAPRGGPVTIVLRDGAVRRGGRVAPFLDGTYRLVLPRADVDAWRAAEVPRDGAAPLMREAGR